MADGEGLEESFARFYSLAQNKNMTVEEALGDVGRGSGWEAAVTRNPNDWEIEEYENLLLFLSNICVLREDDKLIWKP